MNELKMDIQQAISTLSGSGWSQRKIARELGIDRETVARYRRLAREAEAAKPAIPPAGSEPAATSNPAIVPPGSESPTVPASNAAELSNPAISPAGSKSGRLSQCEPFEPLIQEGLDRGLSAQRIYQDLVSEQKFEGSYSSVKRFVRRLDQARPLPFRRMESAPGQEAQVDFGQGAWVVEEGRRRRPHVLRVILSCSRKGYTEAFWQQTTENFIRGLENALRHFGGVVRTLVIDNLRAAVKKVDWFEPELNPKVVSFCEHYGTVILPTKPAMPRHKGKVEAGVKYVQDNGLAGRVFEGLAPQNLYLAHWEAAVADKRIHGTTRQQVGTHFLTVEKPKLLPLPASLFPAFEEAQRTVHRDGHIELRKAYYSVPPEYLGRKVWVRWESRLVRIYTQRMEQLALHTRHEPGKFATDPAHIHDHKRALIERGADWLLDRARLMGKYSGTWAEQMYAQRGPWAIRSLHGLLALAEKHPVTELERACQQAIEYGAWRLRDVRELLSRACAVDPQLTFLETHPLIRDLEAYGKIVPVCFTSQTENNQPTENP